MSDVVAVFGADTHVSEHVWVNRPKLRGDAYFGFSQLVDLAIAHKAPLVLAGDCLELLDSQTPTSLTVSFIHRQIDRLRVLGLPLYYISGQHDMASPSWLSAINGWAKDVSCEIFEVGGKSWMGLDYYERRPLEMALANKPKTYGAVLHQRWSELSGGTGNQGNLSDVRATRVVVTGDMHERVHKKIGNLHVFSPGATHKRTTAEPDEHYAILMREGGKFAWQKLKSRQTLRIAIDPRHDVARQLEEIQERVAAIVEAVGEELPPELWAPFVILESGGLVDRAYPRLQQLLGETAHVFARGARVLKTEAVEQELESAASPIGRRDALYRVYEEVVRLREPDPLTVRILMRVQSGDSLAGLREEFC